MTSIGIVYGSSTGNTEEFAQEIAKQLETLTATPVKLVNASGIKPEQLLEFDNLIIGCPTWDIGELQADWDRLHRKLGDLRFDGKNVALFGCGDALSYPDSFQDALGILGKEFRKRGANIVGFWSTEGYEFDASLGVEDGYFFGLALDYDNDYRVSKERIAQWSKQIASEIGMS